MSFITDAYYLKCVYGVLNVIVQDVLDVVPRPRMSSSTPVRRVHMEETDDPGAVEPERVPLQQLPVEVRQRSLGAEEDRTPQHHSMSYKCVESTFYRQPT